MYQLSICRLYLAWAWNFSCPFRLMFYGCLIPISLGFKGGVAEVVTGERRICLQLLSNKQSENASLAWFRASLSRSSNNQKGKRTVDVILCSCCVLLSLSFSEYIYYTLLVSRAFSPVFFTVTSLLLLLLLFLRFFFFKFFSLLLFSC